MGRRVRKLFTCLPFTLITAIFAVLNNTTSAPSVFRPTLLMKRRFSKIISIINKEPWQNRGALSENTPCFINGAKGILIPCGGVQTLKKRGDAGRYTNYTRKQWRNEEKMTFLRGRGRSQLGAWIHKGKWLWHFLFFPGKIKSSFLECVFFKVDPWPTGILYHRMWIPSHVWLPATCPHGHWLKSTF